MSDANSFEHNLAVNERLEKSKLYRNLEANALEDGEVAQASIYAATAREYEDE